MSEDWLEIPQTETAGGDNADDFGQVDVVKIMQDIRQRLAERNNEGVDAAAVAQALRQEMLEDQGSVPGSEIRFALRQRDCDIVPHHYVIDWRIPILGPLHALVRRVINAEIRRYLLPSMKQQSRINQQLRRVVRDLLQENVYLHQELEELRQTSRRPQTQDEV